MHSIWSRGNTIFAFTLSVLSAVTFCCFLSTIWLDNTTPVTISASNPRLKSMVDYAAEGSKSDVAMLSLNIQADVSGVFNWNVKQLFMYLVAEYSTMKNHLNQVVLWDKIVLRDEKTVIIEESIPPKYYFIDDGNHLLTHKNVTLVLKWNVIPNAGYLAMAAGEGQYVLKMPDNYISGRF